MSEKKRLDYRHIICITITLVFVLCGVLHYMGAIGRIIEGCRDFVISIGYYICEMFEIKHGITPTVNELPKVPYFSFLQTSYPTTWFPVSWSEFQNAWSNYWQLWIDKNNFLNYLLLLCRIIIQPLEFFIDILPLIFLLYFVLKRYLVKENNDYDKDSRPLKAFKRFAAHTYHPVKSWCIAFYTFIKENKTYWITWLCLWAFYFNIFAIFIEFLAYYLYFSVSFDVTSLYLQIYKLFLDLSVPFTSIPLWIWIIFGIALFGVIRKKIAYARLNHYERRNRGFINARPIVYMLCGTMGKRKTTAITDMAMSQEVMFRDKAFEKLLENDLKFPNFPWCNLENELKRAMEYH